MNSGTMYSAKKDPATTELATMASAAMDPATMDTAKIHTDK
jgi:hypothetical protein